MEECHLEMVDVPQTEEWREKIDVATKENTRCAVIRPDAENPHKPWLFIPVHFLEPKNPEVLGINIFSEFFRKIFGKDFDDNYSRDGLNYQFNLLVDATQNQIDSLIALVEQE